MESIQWVKIKGKVVIKTVPSTPHQIYCEIILNSEFIIKRTMYADDTGLLSDLFGRLDIILVTQVLCQLYVCFSTISDSIYNTSSRMRQLLFHLFQIRVKLLNPNWCGPWISVRIRQNPDYAYRNHMYRKGLGPSNLSGWDENPDYTCPH